MSNPLVAQQTLLHQISRALDNFKKIGRNNYTAAKIRSRIAQLKEVWKQCMQTHALILEAYPEDTRSKLDYFKLNQLDQHEDLYLNTLDYMCESLESIEPHASNTSSANTSTTPIANSTTTLPHLPPIQLPPFSGEIGEWESFLDSFKSLIIDNRDLTDFSRMHFLVASLKGRAREVIADMTVTGDNFAIAWQALSARFENKRRLIETHVTTLYNLPKLSRESATDLLALCDRANKAISSLKHLGRSPEEMLQDILVFMVSQNLDPVTRRAWKLKFTEDLPLPTYDDLNKFLCARALALEELKSNHLSKNYRESRISSSTTTWASPTKCPLCNKSHFINKCSEFTKRSPKQRREIVKQFKRCFNCLSAKHTVSEYPSKLTCRTCQQKHHTTLHIDSPTNDTLDTISREPNSISTSATASQVTSLTIGKRFATPSPVLLATAYVIVTSQTGRSQLVRALLDQGSEVSFLSETIAQILRVRRIRTCTSISAVGGISAGVCKHAAQIQITSQYDNTQTFTTTAFILPSLTKYIPRRSHVQHDWSHLAHLQLADRDPMGNDPIDLIIGADLYSDIILEGVCKGSAGQPIAQNSHLGWIVSGPITNGDPSLQTIRVFHCSLEQELRRFWEIEELPASQILSTEEKQCENHFQAHHSRDATGRYIVRLPFKQGPPLSIGASRGIAANLLTSLNRRLKVNSDIKQEYAAFLSEYLSLGHMERSASNPSTSSEPQTVYLPHHPVVRDSSTTARVRVVFNASSLTSNGTSLNNHLLVGPKLQNELFDVLLRWRQHRYVYMADIAKMYRQIRIDPRDCDYQRILWNENDLSLPHEYRLLTVTYGTASAPFLALRVIKQLIKDEDNSFPLAVPILQENIYVDDVLFGAPDIPLLIQTRNQVRALLQLGGFQLRKWASNSAESLLDIPPEDHGLAKSKTLQPDESLHVLGIAWVPSLDVFRFHAAFPTQPPRTKRTILSTIAKLFDPLGWSTPLIISAKAFLQQLWHLHLDWDTNIPCDAFAQWEIIYKKLSDIDGLQLPRWIHYGSDTLHYELHGFADASSVAYAAAVYSRLTSTSGQVTTFLLASKSKVAPIKPMSIPRLELSAAVLLSRLMSSVQVALGLLHAPCYCWTDSTVVLSWLNQHPSRWKTFVAHRVATVQTNLPSAKWRHVPTACNPADCASRGQLSLELASNQLWWKGPTWLPLDSSEWPRTEPPSNTAAFLESKPIRSHTTQMNQPWDLGSRYSDWLKLVRVTAYIMRFVNRCQTRSMPPASPTSITLSVAECNQAELFWYKRIQLEVFPRELTALQRGVDLSSRSSILSLTPFLDRSGLLRVGGRLQNSALPSSTKHPIILASHPIVKLIIRHTHLRLLHAGIQLTLSHLRQEFWILRARSLIKSILHQCVVCTRERATVARQLMGQLPTNRVQAPTRAFLHCGVDYAGPILIRASLTRNTTSRKAYIALFVCLATRAIHLELISSYSTSSFLDAFVRFCSRRGLPETMYSDNGTTFIGADKELAKAYREALRDPDFLNRTASDRISWQFIPPHAPHFGGLWEAGVRSVKHHLRRIMGKHTLTFEELTTLLCKIEACLNSRPLSPLNDSVDDYQSLTPGHFLIGSSLTITPEPSLLHLNENRLNRWQLVRQLTERFWKIWQTDYINTLQQKVKWRQMLPQIKEGTMVLIRNDTLPPCKWELGRITRCYSGPDGLKRVALVKTATSEYKRPLSKLCILPIGTSLDGDEPLIENAKMQLSDES